MMHVWLRAASFSGLPLLPPATHTHLTDDEHMHSFLFPLPMMPDLFEAGCVTPSGKRGEERKKSYDECNPYVIAWNLMYPLLLLIIPFPSSHKSLSS
jgi:hypothetical protein